MNILFLCRKKDLSFGQASLARALERRGVQVACVDDDVPLNEDIHKLVARCPEQPSLILHPELDFPLLPQGLEQIDIPTACFQIDTYAYTERRIQWSMLFDHPIVFHPGYQERFERAGHPGVITFYHAARRDLFDGPEVERIFDVGSIGRTHAKVQSARRRVLTKLAARFRLNEWQRSHTFEEVAEVYRRSKIVVNVPRDDFPEDANMRAFEGMAAGCLLISRVPTELTAIGFREGVHFVAYRDEDEIMGLVERYLSNEGDRERIAHAGREKVVTEHTHDNRADTLLQRLVQDSGRFSAPAREWPEWRVRLARLDYYSAHREFGYACAELGRIARIDLRRAFPGAAVVARGLASRARRRLNQILERERSDGRA